MNILTGADFKKGITALACRWDKLKDMMKNELVLSAWETAIRQAELTQEEWSLAVSTAIAELTFLPSPKELIELVRSSKVAQSILDWTTIQDALPLPPEQQREILLHLSPRARTALKAIGGIGSIKFADQRKLEVLEKDFKIVYLQSSTQDCKALAPAAVSTQTDLNIQISHDWEFVSRAFACRDNPQWRDSELRRLSDGGRETFIRAGGVDYLTPELMPDLWRNFSQMYQTSDSDTEKVGNKVSDTDSDPGYITPEQFKWLQEQIKSLSKGSARHAA